MSADLNRLRAALADRYAVLGVLGEGGMATVYRATDLKHRREVAIKVLFHDLAQAIGADRFLHEIEIAAGLQHPRILALYDSGEANGLLYYVMPLVEGESLRDRLLREKQLPIADAVRITREVASALAYAHSRGIVHRDIKPANILLSGGEAVVADFGIALALNAAGRTRMTITGISVGTPAYMSPEQASGEDVDARTDVYSLGCVLYEMLAGMPPYAGPTAESVVRQHVAAPVPRASVVRPTVSPALEETIERALAKVPADRIQSAAQFLAELDNAVSMPVQQFRPGPRSVGRARMLRVAVAAALAALGATLGYKLFTRASRPTPDPTLIAVLPFRVSGDSSVAYLREGMVDLLTTQLGALQGSRPLDSRTVLSSWRRAFKGEEPSPREARELAMRMGSGRYVLGDIITTAAELSIAARIIDVEGGREIPASVRGHKDSLFFLVDDLMSRLIAGSVREPGARLAELTSASLPAVRAYLDGRAALRAGAMERARGKFTEALELDSTFALAALGMASSGVWSQQAGQSAALRRGLLTGYALRERLSRRDQLLFEAWVLPNTSTTHTARDQLDGWQRAAEAAPESPEAVYEYADRLYHSGEQLGVANATARAESSFARALALDSTYLPPLAHLVEIAVRSNDRRALRHLATLFGVESSTADAGDYVRWRVALVLNDQRTLTALRGRLATMPQASLNRIIGFGLTDGAQMSDIDAAASELRRRVEAGTDTRGNVHPGQSLHNWALNRGRRSEVARAIAEVAEDEPLAAGSSIVFFSADQIPVLDALFWDGDSVAARDAVSRIERSVAAARANNSSERARLSTNLCVATLWHQSTGSVAGAQPLLARLRSSATTRDSAAVHGADPTLCLTLLDAMTATANGTREAQSLVMRLDSLLAEGPYVFGSDWGNLALARLFESRGDTASAFRVVRRRPYDWDTGPLYLSTYLREEGRLAALTGDKAAAARAYERFLALRASADESYRAQIDDVRSALAKVR
jgi:serine/threonine-protein kinase